MINELAPLHEHEGPALVRGQPLIGEAHNLVGDSPDLWGNKVSKGAWTADLQGAGANPGLRGVQQRPLLELMEPLLFFCPAPFCPPVSQEM